MNKFNFNLGKDKTNLIFIALVGIFTLIMMIFYPAIRKLVGYSMVVVFLFLIGSKVWRMHKEGMSDTSAAEKMSSAKANSVDIAAKTKAKAIDALIQTGDTRNIKEALRWDGNMDASKKDGDL